MTTKEKRYAVTVPKGIASVLCLESKNKNISVSRVILDLIEEALELREDMELSKLADEALERNKHGPWFSHEEVMKRCGLE